MANEKYALLDTDFISKMHLIRKDDHNKLIDKIMAMPGYCFYCHKQIQVEIMRHNIAGAPEWFQSKIESKSICMYDDEMILDELSGVYGEWAISAYAGMLKTACDAYKDGYFEEKFVLVSQMDCRSISREDFLKQLQDDCDTIGEGQNLGELKSYVLLQVLNLKFGEQIYVFCSDDKNARNGVISIGGARCISVLSSFVRLKKEISFTKEDAMPYIDSYMNTCLGKDQTAFRVQDTSKERRMCRIPCEQVFEEIFDAGYYQVLSAEVGGKHGFSVSGLVFDEIHTQPNRQLYDVLTKGSSDARQNPLHFIITTAGNDRHSIAYELHTKAVDILEGRRVDPTFYPVVYGLKDDEDWEDEANWYKVNPSLGYTVDIERLRDAYREAKQNPADEITFKWLRCNMWVSSTVAWIPDAIYMRGNEPIDMDALAGRDCYAGLDLSSTGDITALVLIFPPRDEEEKYVLLPYFWIPEETIPRRVKANSVPYDIWEKQGYIMSTEGNVIHYDFIEKFIMDLSEKYHILEIAVDRWNATQMIQNLEGEGFTIVPFGQGFSSMSAPTKEFYRLLMEGRIIHGGNPVLRWMAGNVVIDTDPAGNIKVTKAKSKEKIDGIVAAIMALDRCIRQEGQSGSVYDERGLLVF